MLRPLASLQREASKKLDLCAHDINNVRDEGSTSLARVPSSLVRLGMVKPRRRPSDGSERWRSDWEPTCGGPLRKVRDRVGPRRKLERLRGQSKQLPKALDEQVPARGDVDCECHGNKQVVNDGLCRHVADDEEQYGEAEHH